LIHENTALDVVLFVAILIPSIILHEVAHGWVAARFGDPTARQAGRLTLNPIPHIDPIGSLLLPGLLALAGQNVFGWAKPVPVNPAAFRRPNEQMAIVALAGPSTNLILAFLLVTAGRFTTDAVVNCPGLGWARNGLCLGAGEAVFTSGIGTRTLLAAAVVNVALAIFNMLPIPPLDGSRLLPLVLPEKARATYLQVSQYGFIILFLLVFVFDGALAFIGDVIGWILRVML
jgi:Zn-dependent protease